MPVLLFDRVGLLLERGRATMSRIRETGTGTLRVAPGRADRRATQVHLQIGACDGVTELGRPPRHRQYHMYGDARDRLMPLIASGARPPSERRTSGVCDLREHN